MSCNREPFLLRPAYKNYLWGGERLKESYGKKTDITPLAEAWECSTHPDGESVIASGENKGRTLKEVLKENPDWLGTHPKTVGELPILVKYIDAKQDLSVQVHPDDEYALKHEGQLGKTEMWYVLEAEPGARLAYGFGHEITEEQLRSSIAEGRLMKRLNTVEVHKGDVFFIRPGTVHAIGAGAVIAEIQESSNVTYRLYDYNRQDKDGRLRELHIDKAAQVLDYRASDVRQKMRVLRYRPGYAREHLCRCEYFNVDRVILNGEYTENVGELSFVCVMCIGGEMLLTAGEAELKMKKGDTAFIPANAGYVSGSGRCELLVITC